MTAPTFRDAENLSAYLDEQLPRGIATRLQQRLDSDPQLGAVYEQLRQARHLLRQLPARRAPRNFTLTPKMAGLKAPTPRAVPVFRFASLLASLLLLLTFAANNLSALSIPSMAAAPVTAYNAAGMEAPLEQSQPPEASAAPMLAAPALPEASAAPTTTPELLRMDPAPADKLAPQNESPRFTGFIPAWVQLGLLAGAILTALAGWLLHQKASADFTRKNPQ
jgi:hypothetical protein